MENHEPTQKQVAAFTIVMSFIVSIVGTVLALGIFGPLLGLGEGSSAPFFINKPQLLQKITETVTERETAERILRQDELVVGVVAEASPAVVSIIATKDVPVIEQFYTSPFGNDPFFQQFFGDDTFGFQIPQFRQKGTTKQEVSSGTGFIVSAEGLVITNRHVVEDTAAEYTALFNDGSKRAAKVMARDPLQDLAVLKLEGGGSFPALRLGSSADVKIGQTVIAIGNALGEFRNTVSVGVVSGLQRSVVAGGALSGPETLQELVQTDAAINPGNSGGPLINLRGEVIGVNVAIASGAQNIGFAIPVDKAKYDLASVAASGKIVYPFLGVRYIAITKSIAEAEKLPREYGALLKGSESDPAVASGSPAAAAGLKAGDIILEINGTRIDADQSLGSVIQRLHVGDEITLKVFRDGAEFEVKAKLAERKL